MSPRGYSVANRPGVITSRKHAAADQYSRKRTSGRNRAPGPGSLGAIRNTDLPSAPGFDHYGKTVLALTFIAGGIFWTTASTGKTSAPKEATAAELQPLIIQQAKVNAPTFFFDDSVDALAEHFSNRPETINQSADGLSAHSDSVADVPVNFKNPSDLNSIFDFSEAKNTVTADSAVDEETVSPSPLIDHPSIEAVRNQQIAPDGAETSTVTVASGNTLSGILNNHGVTVDQMPQLLTDSVVKDHLSNLRIGQELEITQLADGEFHSLEVRVGNDKRITIRRSANDFAVASIDLPVEKERVVTSGTIEQSLYLAAEQANLKQSTIMELADIFQWELDFARDIRKGDQFALVYDRLYRDGSYIGDGDILAAEFSRGGKIHRAIRFTTDDGNTSYYKPSGESLRRTFMRHPVDLVRITSRFDPNRLHPVLHKIRAHRGVDYGSPYGSPIYATADGTVESSGSKGTYGRTVVLQHGQRFSTLYAHMSKISSKSIVGKRVRQGDVIGYVGKSGRVTGTHLHYEFRVNGEHVDPLKVELPAAKPLPKKYMAELKAMSGEMTAQMQSVLDEIDQIASAD